MAGDAARPFLTAEWRDLLLANYEVPRALLEHLVPQGTELDQHDGRVYVSLVAFRFLRTRVRGCRVPFHEDFDEANLRFYVRHVVAGEVRRGVCFVREVVPRRAIAFVARAIYNEPYLALPMRSEVTRGDGSASMKARYAWRSRAGWIALAMEAAGAPALPAPGSAAAFITEHYWGYTRQRDGQTIEYRVTHPAWRTWVASRVEVAGNLSALYGDAFGEALAGSPASAFIAEGSAVAVNHPTRLSERRPAV